MYLTIRHWQRVARICAMDLAVVIRTNIKDNVQRKYDLKLQYIQQRFQPEQLLDSLLIILGFFTATPIPK